MVNGAYDTVETWKLTVDYLWHLLGWLVYIIRSTCCPPRLEATPPHSLHPLQRKPRRTTNHDNKWLDPFTFWFGVVKFIRWAGQANTGTRLLCKCKMLYLLTCRVGRYLLLVFQNSTPRSLAGDGCSSSGEQGQTLGQHRPRVYDAGSVLSKRLPALPSYADACLLCEIRLGNLLMSAGKHGKLRVGKYVMEAGQAWRIARASQKNQIRLCEFRLTNHSFKYVPEDGLQRV